MIRGRGDAQGIGAAGIALHAAVQPGRSSIATGTVRHPKETKDRTRSLGTLWTGRAQEATSDSKPIDHQVTVLWAGSWLGCRGVEAPKIPVREYDQPVRGYERKPHH